ncbi:MAG: GGDEF domain-containing protein [Pseudomonadota bacterium]|nr:GGDEF domain-containing protein [Pseudomonadota bacterium]
MNINEKLSQFVSDPLEWSAARKAALLLWMYLFDQVFYLLFVLAAQKIDAMAPWFDLAQVAYHSVFYVWLTALTIVLLMVAQLAPRRYQDNVLYEYMGCLYFGLTHVYYGYCVGLMSIPVGVVLVGAPVVGFILLNRWPVAIAFGTSLLLLFALSAATDAGWLPYAPVARNMMGPDGNMATVWVISYWTLAMPHILFIFALAYYVLQRWRMREQEVTLLSRTDALTGLVNRRHIMSLLELEVADCAAKQLPLSIVMVDLDHFKRINDEWGHDVGDRALVSAAEALCRAVRQHDHVGRYGGEEFLVVLPGLDAAQAKLLAERVRGAIAAVELTLPNGAEISLSASLGMSCNAVSEPITVDRLIKQADLALYQAKDAGRDRLVIAA